MPDPTDHADIANTPERSDDVDHSDTANNPESSDDVDVRQVIEHEYRLLTPAVRSSAAQLESLLHPDFTEFGASGQVWDRTSTVAALTAEPPATAVIQVSNLRAVRLADTVIQLTYITETPPRRAHRSSLWRRTAPATWRLYFHQATPTP